MEERDREKRKKVERKRNIHDEGLNEETEKNGMKMIGIRKWVHEYNFSIDNVHKRREREMVDARVLFLGEIWTIFGFSQILGF
ncbi:hypothetical protein LR48_Vigan272s002900 [Vigna angularis]|uniref:Uncharacterized protein n=1 Tax=Phaseolus angularis TaxID=3914 RepID=A0A0L9T7Y3_PHAAN|nr:hypothetical protein LR48_Vigan272s002900 [Vigna angularis]